MALIESAESSNRIEGVTVERSRLRPLVLGKSRPRDRSEEEIVGYGRALSRIHANQEKIQITPEEELCLSYRTALNQRQVAALLAVAGLVLDFLCIHPFRDGNGRVLRLTLMW